MVTQLKTKLLYVAFLGHEPELKGTIEVKGEYGRASSTVRTLELVREAPLTMGLAFLPFALPFWRE